MTLLTRRTALKTLAGAGAVPFLPWLSDEGLAAFAEEDNVLPGENSVLDLGYDGVLITHHTLENRVAAAQLRDEVAAQLFPHRHDAMSTLTELAKCFR